MDTHEPIERHPAPCFFIGWRGSRVEHFGNPRLEHLPLIIGEPVVPGSQKRPNHRRYAFGVIAVGLASEVGRGFHSAHTLSSFVLPAFERERFKKLIHRVTSSFFIIS
jgi:hypothetical protein